MFTPVRYEYNGHVIIQSQPETFYVDTMPRRGSNEFGFRYLTSAQEYIDRKLKSAPEARAIRKQERLVADLTHRLTTCDIAGFHKIQQELFAQQKVLESMREKK
jgi:hypothetical protein